jgi:small GTP-binding protein
VNAVLGEERMIAFDEPGTTRDAISLDFERGGQKYTIIDTAGIRRRGKRFEAIEKFSVIKTLQAIEDANVVILLLDALDGITEQDAHLAGHILETGRALVVAINKWDAADTEQRAVITRDLERKLGFLAFAEQHQISARDGREGLAPQDRAIADLLRKSGRPVVLAVNKTEGLPPATTVAEFHELGVGDPLPISAAHGENVHDLIDIALARCPPAAADDAADEREEGGARRIKVAVVGRPNVGKSTLVNALLGEERVITFDEPGTTRDAIHLDFECGERRYTVIDTAGVRRRGKVSETVEKFSVIKTLQAIEDAHVVILLVDAVGGITEQDAHLAGHILEAGRALVVAINKWDAADTQARATIKREFDRKLGFLDFAEHH